MFCEVYRPKSGAVVRKKVLGYSSKDFSAAHIAAMAETSEKVILPSSHAYCLCD